MPPTRLGSNDVLKVLKVTLDYGVTRSSRASPAAGPCGSSRTTPGAHVEAAGLLDAFLARSAGADTAATAARTAAHPAETRS